MSRSLSQSPMIDRPDIFISYRWPRDTTEVSPYETPCLVDRIVDPEAGIVRLELHYIDGDEETDDTKIDRDLSMRLGKYTKRLRAIKVDAGRSLVAGAIVPEYAIKIAPRVIEALGRQPLGNAELNRVIAEAAIRQYLAQNLEPTPPIK